uniref:Uncharacterized protein n=1 Tax=Pristionchus pacificus TaxID=54126 RepID=A0A2A6C6K9_PRIPA
NRPWTDDRRQQWEKMRRMERGMRPRPSIDFSRAASLPPSSLPKRQSMLIRNRVHETRSPLPLAYAVWSSVEEGGVFEN